MMTQREYLQCHLESTISPMDFTALQQEAPTSVILLDVRNAPAHLKKIKILGALDKPEKDLADQLSELPKDKLIVVYCWDVWCNLAKKASLRLLDAGFQVKELHGGIAAWQILQLPTASAE